MTPVAEGEAGRPMPAGPTDGFYLVMACPDCRGRGWRIITQDGTRPPCLTCQGTGLVPDVPAGRGGDGGCEDGEA